MRSTCARADAWSVATFSLESKSIVATSRSSTGWSSTGVSTAVLTGAGDVDGAASVIIIESVIVAGVERSSG